MVRKFVSALMLLALLAGTGVALSGCVVAPYGHGHGHHGYSWDHGGGHHGGHWGGGHRR